jgi:hypothetical protein
MRPEVSAFVASGPLPDEEAAQDGIDRRERQLEAITRPLSRAEAEALAGCFGPDDCYGIAWTMAHLIETAPGPVYTPEPASDVGAHARIRGWAVAAGLVAHGVGPEASGGERGGTSPT